MPAQWLLLIWSLLLSLFLLLVVVVVVIIIVIIIISSSSSSYSGIRAAGFGNWSAAGVIRNTIIIG